VHRKGPARSSSHGDDFFINFAQRTRKKLQAHDVFVNLVLCRASIPSANNPSLFTLLDQSEETSLAIKKLVAAYAGVPLEPNLEMLRRAGNTLSLGGFGWDDLQCNKSRDDE